MIHDNPMESLALAATFAFSKEPETPLAPFLMRRYSRPGRGISTIQPTNAKLFALVLVLVY